MAGFLFTHWAGPLIPQLFTPHLLVGVVFSPPRARTKTPNFPKQHRRHSHEYKYEVGVLRKACDDGEG